MTLTALEWIAASGVDGDIFDLWPDYRATLVAVDEVDLDRLASVADELVRQAVDAARTADDVDPHIALWHAAYRQFGVKPRVARVSVDALIRRATSDGGLPRISTVVDLYNAISVLYRVPIGGEDLDRYEGPARLVLSAGDEPFLTTAHGEPLVEHPEHGEPVWVDGAGVTCRRWNWRQTSRTAIGPTTSRVGFIVDSLDAPGHTGAERAVEHLARLLPVASIRHLGLS